MNDPLCRSGARAAALGKGVWPALASLDAAHVLEAFAKLLQRKPAGLKAVRRCSLQQQFADTLGDPALLKGFFQLGGAGRGPLPFA